MLGSKRETLENLKGYLKNSSVCPIYNLTYSNWLKERDKQIQEISNSFEKVIIRSCASDEDTEGASNAGHYESILNIDTSQEQSLSSAIEEVFSSYKKDQLESSEVLIQPMLQDIALSGVAFTQDLNTGSPYYVINYDDESGRTDTITGGMKTNKTVILHRDSTHLAKSNRIKKVINSIREVESITNNNALDIEFAVTKNEEVFIFQVRPLTLQSSWDSKVIENVNLALQTVENFLINQNVKNKKEGLPEKIWGQMPDWNPAEMIGPTPRQLSSSLYKILITDSSWRIARRLMGYNERPGTSLLFLLYGQPYIDTQESFFSLLPASIPEELKKKIVGSWLGYLKENPHLHDKIEFGVATTVFTPDFDQIMEERYSSVLNNEEYSLYRAKLKELTEDLISGNIASIDEQLDTIKRLEQFQETPNSEATFQTIVDGLDKCRELGIIPFSVLARHGFIAKSYLDSLKTLNVLSETDIESFLSSVPTITSEFLNDISSVKSKEDIEKFMKRYGHLRPGTYDILSARYDQRSVIDLNSNTKAEPHTNFRLSGEKLSSIQSCLDESGLSKFKAEELLDYIKKAIQGREYAKFIFSKTISDILEKIKVLGDDLGLSDDTMSYIPIHDLLKSETNIYDKDIKHYLLKKSENYKAQFRITKALLFPHIIVSPEDVRVFPLLRTSPNFVTKKHVNEKTIFLSGRETENIDLANAVIIIESADPGFDWIFAKEIKGLVTKYGGANSHMAIRCAELGIPAAIGVGSQIFDRLIKATAIDLNCAEKRITPEYL